LVDGDPWGGGLCAALSAQDVPGLRWPELLCATGAINPDQLAAALPQLGGLALLSWNTAQEAAGTGAGASQPGAGSARAQATKTVGEVMRAARGAYGLVVVDLGRTPDAFETLAQHCNGVVVVVPAQLRAASAALQMLDALPPKPVAAVVRGPLGEGLDAAMIAAAAGLPLVGRLPPLRHVGEVLESQRFPELLRRRRVRELAANVLGWMAGEGSGGGDMASGGRLPGRIWP
jgi:secretion/DNA translocation related CpaE-like protein